MVRILGVTLFAVFLAVSGLAGATGLSPMYRFYSQEGQSHFYTISASERDWVMEFLPSYTDEGVGFYAYPGAASGLIPIYRFYNGRASHFYTANVQERDWVVENLPHMQYEGVGFYAYDSLGSDTGSARKPVYRFYNVQSGVHFYTISEQEKDQVIATLPGFYFEGVAFYALADSYDPDAPPITEGEWYRPSVTTTWQLQLTDTVNTQYPVQIYDIDLFDTASELFEQLQQEGKKVICYFSAGSYEEWRSDADRFLPEELGSPLDSWEGEWWLDVRSANVRAIMAARLDLAKAKGCDGVDLDNVNGYTNPTGFSLTAEDQLAFNRFLANEAHKRGLAVGLKNDLEQVEDLLDYFDFSVNEQCHEYDECALLLPFVQVNKPVFNAEYGQDYVDDAEARQQLCTSAREMGLRTLVLPLDLDDSFRFSCD